ncbi:MAG: FitA-like ribbon-helix-helix domain-containing protein [Beijerinckiaceae bacterium]
MATLTIRNLPDEVRDALRIRAARNRRSMEAEARASLIEAAGRPLPDDRDWKSVVAEVQAEMAPYADRMAGVVDSLIADRRREAALENEEAIVWSKDHRSS